MSNVIIRAETAADKEHIFSVAAQAFPSKAEAELVNALREKDEAQISLVAEQDGEIIGHILFSPMIVSSEEGQKPSFTASALAPVSVLPSRQKQGVGSALIKKGVEELQAKEIDACFLLGDHAYYGRFGFDVEAAAPFCSPYAGPYFQLLHLSNKQLTPCAVGYASAFEGI